MKLRIPNQARLLLLSILSCYIVLYSYKIGKNATISLNDPVIAANNIPLLINGSLWHSNFSDGKSDGTIFSNNTLLVFNNSKSLQYSNITNALVRSVNNTINSKDKTLHQFNESYTCHIGNTTISLPIFPHFIIVGAQKAGTSAISAILARSIPNFLHTETREGHYWDTNGMRTIEEAEKVSSDNRCKSLKSYFKKWNPELVKPDTIFFEKTPRLLPMPTIPKVIDYILPHKPKIIIILRNPVDRLYSQYKMDKQRYPHHPPFEYMLKTQLYFLTKREALQVPPYSNMTREWNQSDFMIGKPLNNYEDRLARGFYAEQVKSYMEVFKIDEMLKVVRFENFQKNKTAVLQDLVNFIGGPSYINFSEKLLNEELGPLKKKNAFPPMMNETKIYLKHLYKPFNDELANLLGESWRDVWK